MKKLRHSDLFKSHGEQVVGLRLELDHPSPNPFLLSSFIYSSYIYLVCYVLRTHGEQTKDQGPALVELTV